MAQTFHRTTVNKDILNRIDEHVTNASLGGKSHVRNDMHRKARLHIDQFTGQLGEFALCRWFDNENVYWERRATIDKTPWVGDGGTDFPGLDVDVKTSYMRRRGKKPSQYNLPVRPAERHENNIYVLALVDPFDDQFGGINVWLIGWAKDKDLPPLQTQGVFAGAHLLSADKLQEMDTLDAELGYYRPTAQSKGI